MIRRQVRYVPNCRSRVPWLHFFGDDVVHGSGKGVRLFCGGGLRDVSMTVSLWGNGRRAQGQGVP